MKPCPRCNHEVQEDQTECPNCGVVFATSKASTGNSVSTQQSWGAIWAQQVEKRGQGWRIFLFLYLAGLSVIAFFVITAPAGFPPAIRLVGFLAFCWFLFALIIASLLNWIWSIWKTISIYKESTSEGLWEVAALSVRQLSWFRVFAVVLTSSKFIFLTIFAVSLAIYVSMEKMGGQYVEPGVKPYDGMVAIAAVPNPAKQGAVKLEQVMLRDMEKFKAANPAHSFLLPPGSGRVQESGDRSTRYEVQPVGDGKVLVETKYHQEMGGLLIMRYEATDKSVRPIFTNNVQWSAALFFGIMLAAVLYVIGRVLRYLAAKHRETP